MKKYKIILAMLFVMSICGCSQQKISARHDAESLGSQARQLLIQACHSPSPLLRSHAIEALSQTHQSSAVNLIVAGLSDEYWGVRFTACMGILEMKYEPAKAQIRKMLKSDPDKSVRAAAAGTLHVMGDKRYTSLLGKSLFDEDVIVRRNTAMVLGRMGDAGACKLLKSAIIRDEDLSVKLQAMEAMAILGDSWAQRLMINNCRSVFDDERILAIMALANARVQAAGDTFAYIYDKSAEPDRLGMRLVTARALAMLGDFRGQCVAIESLDYNEGDAAQAVMIRKLAAMALGDMGDPAALPELARALGDKDEDVQIAAALAILKINQASMQLN